MASLLNLPSDISIDIFSRLPVRSIMSCKCVSKNMLEQLSSPDFVKYHLSRVTPGLIVNIGKKERAKRCLFTLTDELIVNIGNRRKNACRIFEIEEDQEHGRDYKPVGKFNPNMLSRSPDADVRILSSVNGFVCLREFENEFDCERAFDAIYICNPITHEYIHLPIIRRPNKCYSRHSYFIKYGFGISLLSGQYKVVRISNKDCDTGVSDLSKVECMVYTLGTNAWRSIEPNEVYGNDLRSSHCPFLNGNLHWLAVDANGSQLISCFDLETELFKPLPPPFSGRIPQSSLWMTQTASLTILGNCLCFCNFKLDEESIDIWIMNEYGVKESWTKQFVFNPFLSRYKEYIVGDGCVDHHLVDDFYATYEYPKDADTFYALKVFEDGDLLMLRNCCYLFYHCKKTESNPELDFFGGRKDCWIYAMLHTPSFVSLRSLVLKGVASFSTLPQL